jgi:hypothetical protein
MANLNIWYRLLILNLAFLFQLQRFVAYLRRGVMGSVSIVPIAMYALVS